MIFRSIVIVGNAYYNEQRAEEIRMSKIGGRKHDNNIKMTRNTVK